MDSERRNAIITGGSLGLGRALARLLAARGWRLTLDARDDARLAEVRSSLADPTGTQALAGDVADPAHRRQLVAAAASLGPIDLLVNNASDLGASPLPRLRALGQTTLERLWRVNVAAPLELVQLALPQFAPGAVVINISSDAAVEHYESWGGYGATKAALDHQTLTWAAEEPSITWYAVDPGDMRTAMHQAAFPGEDISDRPEPETVAPALAALIDSGLPSGRYRAGELLTTLLSEPEVTAR